VKINGIIWLKDVIYKLWWKYNVTTDEVEEVFINNPRYRFHERGNMRGEDLYTAYKTLKLSCSKKVRKKILFFRTEGLQISCGNIISCKGRSFLKVILSYHA